MKTSPQIHVGGRIDVVALKELPEPAIRKEFHWIRSRPLWGDLHEGEMRITDGASWMTINHFQREAKIHLSSETGKDLPFFSRTFLALPVVELLRSAGYIYIHGALVARRGRGVLLLGSGGAGKSTAAAALWQSGWDLMGDDSLLYHAESRTIFPFETDLGLSPDVMEQLPHSKLAYADRKKMRVDLDLLPRTSKSFHGPLAIVSLGTGPDDRIELLPRSKVFGILNRENPLLPAVPTLSKPHFQAVSQLASSSECFQMTLRHEKTLHLGALGKRIQSLLSGSLTKNLPCR